MDAKQLQETLDFAVDCAALAGATTLAHFNTGLTPEWKPDRSPVTIADRAAEELLRKRIAAAYPEDGILGEEFGEQAGRSGARWILDPLDGTTSFISGVPLYAVLIGLEYRGEMVLGVMHFPALRDTVYAARGLGCRWNGRPAHVSGVATLSEARMTCTSSKLAHDADRGAAYDRLRARVTTERGWCDAYGYALLATGRVEIALDPIMAIWDNAALVPVVTEAGGKFTDWSNNPTHTSPEALATNGILHDEVLAVLNAD